MECGAPAPLSNVSVMGKDDKFIGEKKDHTPSPIKDKRGSL
jgi:hypothetical protein